MCYFVSDFRAYSGVCLLEDKVKVTRVSGVLAAMKEWVREQTDLKVQELYRHTSKVEQEMKPNDDSR